MKIVFTSPARQDLIEAYTYIATDSLRAAARFLDDVDAVVQHLADGELTGPEARLKSGRRVQSWPVPPYRIYYRRTSRTMTIYRAHHQARRPIE